MKKILIFTVFVALLIPGASFARKARYKVVEVNNGGIVKGKVKTAIKVKDPVIAINIPPKEDQKETETERKTCGESQQAEMYIVSPSDEVKNVLVIVEGVKKGKAAPKSDLKINNHNCRFDPLVSISYVKSNYIIKNSDPLFHNTSLGVLLKDKRRAVYNLALPYQDQEIKKRNRVAGLIDLKCDAHPWMRAYVYSSRHPYVTITDANGNYELKDLLPGKYTVRFWHEGFEEKEKEIEVKAGKVSELDVSFSKTRQPDFLGRL